MRGAKVSYADDGRFVVDGLPGLEWANDVLGGPLDVVGPASLTSLRHAVKAAIRRYGSPDEPVTLWLSTTPAKYFDHDLTVWDPVSLTLDSDEWSVDVELWRDRRLDGARIDRLIGPLLRRAGASYGGCEAEEYDEGATWRITVSVRWPSRGKTVLDGLMLGRQLVMLLEASNGGDLTLETARDLAISGHIELLRGQPERQWLDAKGAPYALTDPGRRDRAAWELAKDVAAFANAEAGGLIALGLTTQDRGEGEFVSGFKEFPLAQVNRQSYRNHVAQKVFPRVVGFEVIRIPASSPETGFALLVIPPQAESDVPFLVRGAATGAGVLGSHVLWPVRREDDTAAIPIETLHALLRLGEAHLRQPSCLDPHAK